MVFASYGAFIFAEELFSMYAIYFVILKGGQYLERSNSRELRKIGQTLQDLSIITATASTTLLVRLLEMTFWASRQCLDVTLQIGSSILKPLLPSGVPQQANESEAAANLCKDLILASQNASEGIQFKNPELKVIAAPLEAYHALNVQQFFGDWRLGREKRLMIEAFLFKMRVLDVSPEPLEQKLLEAQKELLKIKDTPSVYNQKTAEAVDQAEQILLMVQDPEEMQLVVYQPPVNNAFG